MLRTESVGVSLLVRVTCLFLEGGGTVATPILDLVRPRSVGMLRTESVGVVLLVRVTGSFLGVGRTVATRIPGPDSGWNTFSFPGTVRLPESVSVTFVRHLLESEGGFTRGRLWK